MDMVSVYQLKPRFQALLRPAVRWLAARGVTANAVTLAAAALSVAYGALIAGMAYGAATPPFWPLLLLPALLFIRMGLNAIDGMLAREHDQTSRVGAVLNELGDLISDAALYLPFAFVATLSAPLVVGAVAVALIAEATGILAHALCGTRSYAGPMGKSDRAAAFSVIAVWLALDLPASGTVANVGAALVIGLGFITIINRAKAAVRDGEGLA